MQVNGELTVEDVTSDIAICLGYVSPDNFRPIDFAKKRTLSMKVLLSAEGTLVDQADPPRAIGMPVVSDSSTESLKQPIIYRLDKGPNHPIRQSFSEPAGATSRTLIARKVSEPIYKMYRHSSMISQTGSKHSQAGSKHSQAGSATEIESYTSSPQLSESSHSNPAVWRRLSQKTDSEIMLKEFEKKDESYM